MDHSTYHRGRIGDRVLPVDGTKSLLPLEVESSIFVGCASVYDIQCFDAKDFWGERGVGMRVDWTVSWNVRLFLVKGYVCSSEWVCSCCLCGYLLCSKERGLKMVTGWRRWSKGAEAREQDRALTIEQASYEA